MSVTCFIHNAADMMSLTHCLLSCPHLFVRHFLPFIILKLNYRTTQMHRVPLLSQFFSPLLFPAAFSALALGKCLSVVCTFLPWNVSTSTGWIYMTFYSYINDPLMLNPTDFCFSVLFPLYLVRYCMSVSLVGADIHGTLMMYITEFGHSLTFSSNQFDICIWKRDFPWRLLNGLPRNLDAWQHLS